MTTGDGREDAAGRVIDTAMIREQLADYAHEAWSGWMYWMLPKLRLCKEQPDGSLTLTAHADHWLDDESKAHLTRWQIQVETPYADLSDAEQDSDRREADRMLAIMQPLIDALDAAERENARLRDEMQGMARLNYRGKLPPRRIHDDATPSDSDEGSAS